MAKLRRFVVKAWGLFRDNFVPLAIILAILWLMVVWISFVRGDIKLEALTPYAMFGTAMVTLLLAVATYLMVRETSASRKLNEKLIEENRKLAEAPRIRELIIRVINPLLQSVEEIRGCHERREYMWITPDLGIAKRLLIAEEASIFQIRAESAFFPHPRLAIEQNASVFDQPNQALYRDYKKIHSSLTERIERHDKKAEGFRHLLLDLAKEILSPNFKGIVESWRDLASKSELRELTLSMACLAFNELLGASEKFSYDQPGVRRFKDFWMDKGPPPLSSTHGDFLMQERCNSTNIKDKVEQITKEADGLVKELKRIEADLLQIRDGYQQEYHLTHEETEKKPRSRGVEL